MKITGTRFVLTSLASFIAWQVQAQGFEEVGNGAEPAPALFLAQANVPPGFEALSIAQRSLVDIYYGNRYLGSQLATYTPTSIRFSDPATIVRLIGDISDRGLIAEGLTGELNTNAEKICFTQGQTDCGIMEPAISSVIFDESRFRVDVFVNRRFLETREANISKFLPPSDADYSFMQNFAATFSGTRGDNSTTTNTDTDDYSIYGTSVFAKGENSLYARWDYSKTQHFSVGDLYSQREFEGVRYRAGLMNSEGFGLSFTSDRTLTGVRIGSSDQTRTDTSFTGGIPLDIFLPVRGRVEVRRDDRLIASDFMEAGSQQLNTSAFPSGAYDVEIKVLDEQGNPVSTETRFFAKQFDLPPEGEWRYFMEAGKVMDRTTDNILPEMTKQFLARAGVSRRLTDTMAITTSAAVNAEHSLAEVGLFNIGYLYELSPSVMLGNNGAYGVNVIGRLNMGEVTLNGNHRQLWHNRYDSNVATNDTDYPTLLGDAFRQSSFSFTTPVYDGNASYRFSENQTGDEDTTRTHTISYRTSLYRIQNLDIDLDTSYSESNDDKVALLSFNFRLRDDRWTWRATPRAERRWQDNGNDTRNENLRVSGSWDDGDMFDSTVRADFGAETGRGGERYDTRLEVGNSWGQGNLALNHVVDDTTTTSYAASFRSSFMTDGEHMALGGENSRDSALMVNVTGQDGDVFDVTVNGQRQGYAVVGRPSLVPLSPYEQYTVSITPTGTALYDFDERERTVTLYPGNVVSLDYDAVALQLLFGRLLYNGEPLNGVQLKGGQYPADSDDFGLFQMEVRSDKETVDVILDDGQVCNLPLPEQLGNVLRMGTINLNDADCAIPAPKQEIAEESSDMQLAGIGRESL